KELLTRSRAVDAFGRPEILLKAPAERPTYSLVPLGDAVSASWAGGLTALTDGDRSTAWTMPAPLQGSEWIRVELGEPRRVGRVELVVPGARGIYDPEIAIETSVDGGEMERVACIPLRPRLREQDPAHGARSQDFLLKPRPVRAVRVLQLGARPYAWAVSEIRLYERARP